VPEVPQVQAAPSNAAAAAAKTVQALTPNSTRPIVNADPLPSKPIDTPASAMTRPLSPQEQKTLDRARQQEADAAKRQEQIARVAEQTAAKRNAEIAKKQAELARKQADEDRKKQKEVAEAEKKLKAAQAAYDAEVAKSKKPE
jgi:hypothetical protein